jgi:hydrogenase 3 maturation protease
MVNNLRESLKGKVLIIGIGNRLRGDDGAGPLLIDVLKGEVEATLLDVGEEPLNYLGVVDSAAADTIVVFDAVEMGKPTGSIAKLNLEDLSESTTLSTHSIPVRHVLKMVEMRTDANLVLFGVQAGTLRLGNEMSPEVESAVKRFADTLVQTLPKR